MLSARTGAIRGWAALVTQNILYDRPLLERLARSKCRALFIGLESLDEGFLRRYNKTQNLSARRNIMDDSAFRSGWASRSATAICSTRGYRLSKRCTRNSARSSVLPDFRCRSI